MTDENLFSDDGSTKTDKGDTPPVLNIPDNLKELIGPGKKYATVEKALEALPHAQSHIATLESEAAQLRKQVEQGLDANKVYETVQELLKAQRETPGSAPLDEAAIANLLDRKLTERESQLVAANNLKSVQDAMREKYGDEDKANEVFKTRATELGVGVDFLKDLAKKSPKAAKEMLGLNTKAQGTPARLSSSVNTDALAHTKSTKAPPSVMGNATTGNMITAWRAAAPPKE